MLSRQERVPDPKNQEELTALCGELNDRERATTDILLGRLSSPEGLEMRAVVSQLQRRLGLEIADDPSVRVATDFEVDDVGARALFDILSSHASLGGDRPLEVGLNIFGEPGADRVDLGTFDLAREAVNCFVGGGIVLGQHDDLDDRLVDALVQTAFGASAIDTIIRRALAGRLVDPLWDPSEFYDTLPGGLADLEDVARRGCVVGLRDALRGFAQEVRSTRTDSPLRAVATAAGITSLAPAAGRGHTEVKILGSGFGSAKPSDEDVYFPRAGGGCSRATVLSWSDTEIVVTAPADVGDGYVGFVRAPTAEVSTAEMTAAAELAGALEHCIGPAAAAAADRLSHWIPVGIAPQACPPGLPNDANRFVGGPAIASISPAFVREGDTVAVTGTAFVSTDVVVVGGKAAATAVASDKYLTFTVPAVSGGRHSVVVGGSDGLRSNAVDLRVGPWITGFSNARPRPGTTVGVRGTGFAQGCKVRFGSEQRTATFVGVHDLEIVPWRPAGLPANKAGESVVVQVVLADGTASNTLPLVLDTYRIVALGDSMMWGQGLVPAQKFSNLVAQHVRTKLPGVGVYAEDMGAHSGASIGLNPFVSSKGPVVAGEVPVDDPTVFQQLEEWFFNADRLNVDVVLVTGGINDIGVNTILTPWTSTATIKALCKVHCHDSMKLLLTDAVGTFGPNTKFVVTGYQLMVSWQSDTALLTEFLLLIGVALGAINGAIVGGLLSLWAKWAIVTNCSVFFTEANQQLALAVQEVNATLSAPRVFFAMPSFAPANAVLAPDPWLWGIVLDPFKGAVPEDPVQATRATDCTAAGAARPGLDVNRCRIASLGHPNPTGAQKYADEIVKVL